MKKYKWGVRRKMQWFLMPSVILFYVITALIGNVFYSQELINRSWKEVRRESAILTDQMENTFRNVSSCAKSIVRTLNYDYNKNLLLKKEERPLEAYGRDTVIRGVIYDNSLFYPEAQAIIFLDNQENVYISDPRISTSNDFLLTAVSQLNVKNGQDVWYQPDVRQEGVIYSQEPVCTLGKRVKDIDTGKNLGILFINVQERDLCSHYEQVEEGDNKRYFVTDQCGRIVSASDKTMIWKNLEPVTSERRLKNREFIQERVMFQNKKYLMTAEKMEYCDLYLVNIVDLGVLTASSNKITLLVLLIGCVVLCSFVYLLCLLSKKITKPIELLAEEMSGVHSGNLKLYASVKSQDEIGMLATTCNYMLERIESEKETKRKLQLSLLQSQIKPHFLYNTLDLIYVLNSMGMEEKVEQAIKSLADYYRLALSDGKEVINLDAEVDNVVNYLKIQKMRYSEIFDYEIHIPTYLLKYPIPKLTLQPLVENAIYHGIRPTGRNGKIVITGERRQDDIYITVADNGCGMTQETIDRIMASENMEGHFGIYSVHARIRLLYGADYGIKIDSGLNMGTKICVHLGTEEERVKCKGV